MKEATKATVVLEAVVAEPTREEERMRLLEPAAERVALAMGLVLAREPAKA